MSDRLYLLLALALILVPAGCSERGSTDRQSGPAVSLIPVSFPEWRERLASSGGDIVVVDVWATWCLPCLERFPHMVELHRRFEGEGVRFISMSLDDRGDEAAVHRAREFLIRQNADFENYLMDEPVTDGFEKLGLQSIPAVLIYGRDGELVSRLTGDDPNDQFTAEDVETAVENLLGSSG